MTSRADRLAVVYGPGSASVGELRAAATQKGVEFVVVPSRGLQDAALRASAALGDVLSEELDNVTVSETLRRLGIEGILTFSDDDLVRTADLANALGLRGLKPTVARTVRSKLLQRAALNAAGASAVEAVPVSSPTTPNGADDLSYPAVLKPDAASASRNTYRVRSVAEARDRISALDLSVGEMVLESLIATESGTRDGWLGDYVSVESVVVGDVIISSTVTDRLPLSEPFREQGDVIPSTLPTRDQVAVSSLASSAIHALGIEDAVVHTEIKLAEPPQVIEVNARLGGYVHGLYEHVGAGSLLGAALDVARAAPPAAMGEPRLAAALWSVLPPLNAERLESLPDSTELGRLPGVWRVERLRGPGAAVSSSEGTTGRVLDLWLEAADHDQLRRRLDRVQTFVSETIAFSPGAREPGFPN